SVPKTTSRSTHRSPKFQQRTSRIFEPSSGAIAEAQIERHNCHDYREEGSMVHVRALMLMLGIAAAASAGPGTQSFAQAPADPNSAPNSYSLDANWLKMPDGLKMGQVTGVDIDPDGKSVWVFERCGKRDCVNSTRDPIEKFDASGKFLV